MYTKMLTLIYFVLFMVLSSVFDVKSKIKTQSNIKLVIMSFLDDLSIRKTRLERPNPNPYYKVCS